MVLYNIVSLTTMLHKIIWYQTAAHLLNAPFSETCKSGEDILYLPLRKLN